MTREEAIQIIDQHKNSLINPVEMLRWTWIRVILNNIDDAQWNEALQKATQTLSK